VKVAAFRNTDGSLAVVALNTTRSAVSVPVTLRGTNIGDQATPHLTNGSNTIAAQTAITIVNGSFTSTIPTRSLVTYTIPA
jgi:glucuronoarabinoxylan endo-1,4-beta-xylanase